MENTLKNLAKECIQDYPYNINERNNWLLSKYPAQIIILIELIKW